MESTMNEYIRQMDCELMQVGGLLDAKGQYGFITVSGILWKDALMLTRNCEPIDVIIFRTLNFRLWNWDPA